MRFGAAPVVMTVALSVAVLAACGSDAIDGGAGGEADAIEADRCIVRLHGKGGDGQPSTLADGIATLSPRGNGEGWGGRQWTYFPDERYDEARSVVASSLDDARCRLAVIHGFSNGAAFAGKLYCRGETFDDRLVGLVIDDPVTDAGTAGCVPDSSVDVALYWTSALADDAPPGTDCVAIDWTCDGDTLLGIDAYAAAVGVDAMTSPMTEHEWFDGAPEPLAWLAPAESDGGY